MVVEAVLGATVVVVVVVVDELPFEVVGLTEVALT